MLEGTRVGEGFEDVFRRVLPRAIRVAHRILGNETQAEDAAAEALARAHASWGKIGAAAYCDAWILRVTANVAVDMHRSRKRLFSIGLSVSNARADKGSDPESQLAGMALAAALATLPRRQREVVVLRYLEGMSEEEVATALGVSVGTVKKNAFRARDTLRTRMGGELAEL
jgi:RNA polymerase sigma-70 factor (ECF subfamily)